MFKSGHKTTGQNHYIKAANKSLKNVAKFKYLGMTITNKNSIHEKIKSRLNFLSACYLAVRNLLSSHLLSEA
jgi:ERCC4-related helicase